MKIVADDDSGNMLCKVSPDAEDTSSFPKQDVGVAKSSVFFAEATI